jgi:hypothetical protein
LATVLGRLELGCAHGDGLGEHGVDVVDVPVDDDPGPPSWLRVPGTYLLSMMPSSAW